MYVEELTIPHTELFAPCETSIVTRIGTCVCTRFGVSLGTGAPVALQGNISCLAPFEPISMNQDDSKAV